MLLVKTYLLFIKNDFLKSWNNTKTGSRAYVWLQVWFLILLFLQLKF